MSRNYKPMPPIWRLNELFELSDDCPNGLIWRVNKAKSRCPDTHSVQHLGNTKDNRTPLIETYKIPPTKKLLASGFKI
jgi:hypothetical protein